MAVSRKKFGIAFSNHEIVTLVVFLLGGDAKYIDTEDIAFKANEIAPGRFTWRKYHEQINIKNINAFLYDSKKIKNGAFLSGSEQDGWLLTESGLEFVKKNIHNLKGLDLSKERLSEKEVKWIKIERIRMLGSDAFIKFSQNNAHKITPQEAESFFHIDEYVGDKKRNQKIERVLNCFKDDPELGQIVKFLAQKILHGE